MNYRPMTFTPTPTGFVATGSNPMVEYRFDLDHAGKLIGYSVTICTPDQPLPEPGCVPCAQGKPATMTQTDESKVAWKQAIAEGSNL